MTCGNCGEPVPERKAYCGNCGAYQPVVREASPTGEPVETLPVPARWWAGIVSGAVAASVIPLMVFAVAVGLAWLALLVPIAGVVLLVFSLNKSGWRRFFWSPGATIAFFSTLAVIGFGGFVTCLANLRL